MQKMAEFLALASAIQPAIHALHGTVACAQYMQGNAKAMNSMVGQVLKSYKADPAAVRQLIEKNLAEGQPA